MVWHDVVLGSVGRGDAAHFGNGRSVSVRRDDCARRGRRIGTAAASGGGPSQAQIQKCLDSGQIGDPPPTCTFDANGNLIRRSTPGLGGHSINLAPFIVLAVLWSAVPFAIAVGVAQSRNEPVGSAVLLVIVLGWIGLFIVLYGQRRAVDDVGRLVHSAPAPAPATGSTAPTGAAPAAEASDVSTHAVGERLETLDALYDQGVITVAERDRRRAAILDEV